jgi:hypothetical protein
VITLTKSLWETQQIYQGITWLIQAGKCVEGWSPVACRNWVKGILALPGQALSQWWSAATLWLLCRSASLSAQVLSESHEAEIKLSRCRTHTHSLTHTTSTKSLFCQHLSEEQGAAPWLCLLMDACFSFSTDLSS